MPRHFDPALVNDPFGDPGLYVDLTFERRALLFDIGDIGSLAPRKLLRISDVFVSHRHMDHFAGFDQLLRRILGREKTVRPYGPAGTIAAVEHKLAAYTWNLLDCYNGHLTLRVVELDEAGCMAAAEFSGRERFLRAENEAPEGGDGLLLREPGLEVRATTLDHGAPVLAFALQERARINVWRNRVEAMGLAVGPWLRGFKQAILTCAPDDRPVTVSWAENNPGRPSTLPLGALRREIMKVTSGRKIAYVVDCAYSRQNVERIVALARGAEALFIEATFLEEDAETARQRRHLTARQAGEIARLSGVRRLVTFHYSPRYRGRADCLAREAQAAFLGGCL